ncbi:MAG: HAD family hydrolase [Chloroflexi bacterium]|nr:MAG: HAD family hydrolase [Chloroflexota bacterium]
MKFRAVIFDLDGTLLDTLQDIADSVNLVLERAGLPRYSLDEYRYFIGDGVEHLARRVLPQWQRDDVSVAQVAAAIREEYRQRWSNKTRPYHGIPDLLDFLTTHGIRMAVLSNKPDDFTRLTVSRLLPQWRFDAVVGAQPNGPYKPDPRAALEIADRLGIPPREFVYLGDSGIDMETASAAGMYPVGALWGFRTREELVASGAKETIESPVDLTRLL